MGLLYVVRIAGAPPVEVMPLMALVISAVPVGMMLAYPVRIAHLPPLIAVPDVTVVEVAPPVRMILAHPVRILRPTNTTPDTIRDYYRSHPTIGDNSLTPTRVEPGTNNLLDTKPAGCRKRPTSQDD